MLYEYVHLSILCSMLVSDACSYSSGHVSRNDLLFNSKVLILRTYMCIMRLIIVSLKETQTECTAQHKMKLLWTNMKLFLHSVLDGMFAGKCKNISRFSRNSVSLPNAIITYWILRPTPYRNHVICLQIPWHALIFAVQHNLESIFMTKVNSNKYFCINTQYIMCT